MMVLRMLLETGIMWSYSIGDLMGISGGDLQYILYRIVKLIYGYVGIAVG